jgi:uridylate kinase
LIAVIKLSGSLFNGPDVSGVISIAVALKSYHEAGGGLAVVVGGGQRSREYISLGRKLGLNENYLDTLGIDATKINARLMLGALGGSAFPLVARELDDAALAASTRRIAVFGGLVPGHSTNAVAALVAERLGADIFINATDVDGVFDKDPRMHTDSKLLSRVSVGQLREILESGKSVAGSYELMDSLALLIIERSRIRTVITAYSASNIEKALSGRKVGTEVVFNE